MNQPNPAIVAQSAVRRLPRWALLMLCIAYIVPGYVMRGPWRSADMEAFGYMRELALGHTSWLAPELSGLAVSPDGLLPYWLGAFSIQLFQGLIGPEMAARLPFIALLVMTLVATWWGAYYLARSPGAQPVSFAFGGEANTTDYARTLADGALLALVSCLGLAQLSHETTSYVAQLGFIALLFFAAAAMPYHALKAGLSLLAGMVGLALSGAPAIAVAIGLGCSLIALFSHSWGDKAERNEREALLWSLAWLAATTVAALLAGLLHQWLWRIVSTDTAKDWDSLFQMLLWFCWPAWPLALWTLWVWRRQLRRPLLNPHLTIAAWFAFVPLVATLTTLPADRALLLTFPAVATLAAFALPTLRRSIGALIDWFTLLLFSILAITIWVVWLSLQTGFPAKTASNMARLAPYFKAEFEWLPFLLALAATVFWARLVVWRTSRNRSALWKSLVLPASGATLGWLLITTLWMPVLDHARSYEYQMRQVAQHLPAPSAQACVHTYGMNRAQIAALRYYTNLDTKLLLKGQADQCDWLVIDNERYQEADKTELRAHWEPVTVIKRPTGRSEELLIARRKGRHP